MQVRRLFNGKRTLTKRDAWAATFDTRLTEKEARKDCPMHMPDAPKSLGADRAHAEAVLPLNDLQTDIVQAFATLRGPGVEDHGPLPQVQGEAAGWIQKVVAEVLAGKHVRAVANAGAG